MDIRRLTQEDCDAFRFLRLEALQNAPDAFGSSYEDEKKRPSSDFSDRLNDNIVVGCFMDDNLVGMVGLHLTPEREKTRHIGTVWGMYVTEAARRKNVATELLSALLKDLPPYLEQVKLCVTTHNQAARSVYDDMGFKEYGLEKKALKVGSAYYDECMMVKFIK